MSSIIKLNSRSYYMDRRQFSRSKAKDYRNEPDPGERQPEERSVKANEIWARVWNDFSLGTSQELADTSESSPRRFRQSVNFNPFVTQGELHVSGSLEPYLETPGMIDFFQPTISLATNGTHILVVSQSGLYENAWIGNREDGFEQIPSVQLFAADITTWGSAFYVLGNGVITRLEKFYNDNPLIQPIITVENICSTEQPATCIGYALGRLIYGANNKLYEVILGEEPVEIYAHPNPDFLWWGVEESSQGIYVWGWQEMNDYVYDSGVFFMTTEEYNGALAPPYKVLPLPTGEFVRDLLFYGGYVFLATNVGIRMSQVNELGYLVYGPALEVPDASALYGRGENIYFGFAAYKVGLAANSTIDNDEFWGVGVIHLRELVGELTPPFAMVYGVPGGEYNPQLTPTWPFVTSIGLDNTDTIFAANFDDDNLFFVNEDHKAYEGVIRLGQCSFATSEAVRILGAGIKGYSTVGDEITFREGIRYLHSDTTGFAHKGAIILDNNETNMEEDVECNFRTRRAELALEFQNPSLADPTSVVYQMQMEATPVHYYAEKITLPFLFADWIRDDYGVDISLDLEAEWKILSDLMNNRNLITLELGEETFRGFVQSLEMKPETLMEFSRPFENPGDPKSPYRGMLSGFIYVTFHTLPGYPPAL